MRLRWAAIATFSVALAVAAAEDPFTGNWKLNLTKSRSPTPLPRSQSGRIEVQGQSIRIRMDVVNDDGKSFHIAVDAKFDGEYYPVTGTPFADSVAYRRLDSCTITGKAKKDGKVVGEETAVLARGGKSMTVTYTSEREGKKVTIVAVFEKQ